MHHSGSAMQRTARSCSISTASSAMMCSIRDMAQCSAPRGGQVPSFRFELRCEGRVAGIDEAGRGPLAGPVFAAAAVIDRARAARKLLRKINDSKMLTFEEREEAYEAMIASGAVHFAIAEASVEEIDSINILQATVLAMRRALQALGEAQPAVVLIERDRLPPQLGCRGETIVCGDAHSYLIAPASIFAQGGRDRFMSQPPPTYPDYRWHHTPGYDTAQHI